MGRYLKENEHLADVNFFVPGRVILKLILKLLLNGVIFTHFGVEVKNERR
jgi:hypothetical protein